MMQGGSTHIPMNMTTLGWRRLAMIDTCTDRQAKCISPVVCAVNTKFVTHGSLKCGKHWDMHTEGVCTVCQMSSYLSAALEECLLIMPIA